LLGKLLHSDRCGVCKDYRGHRYCLRLAKNICWRCCNGLRTDGACPADCRFHMQQAQGEVFAQRAAVESRAEYEHLLQSQMERWARNPQEAFEGRIPLVMSTSRDGREQLAAWLSSFTFPPQIPVNHLRKLLNLPTVPVEALPTDHEDAAAAYLARVVEQDWPGTIAMLFYHVHYAEPLWRERYIKRVSSHKVMKKVTEWDLVSSAMSEDRTQALAHYELNKRWPLTLHMLHDGEQWRVAARIFAAPSYKAEEQGLVNRVAVMLHEGKTAEAAETLRTYSPFYPDLADFAYFRGLLSTFERNWKAAREHFLDAVEMDPHFHDARYNLALMHQNLKDAAAAKRCYQEVLAANTNEVKSLNNLAAILIDEGDKEEARRLLERCLALDPEFTFARKNMERLTADSGENRP